MDNYTARYTGAQIDASVGAIAGANNRLKDITAALRGTGYVR